MQSLRLFLVLRRLLPLLVISMFFTSDVGGQGRSGRSVELSGALNEQQFVAGRSVLLRAQVEDEVFAAGSTVTLDGARIKALLAAAGRIEISSSTIGDAVLAAQEMRLDSTVNDDLVAAVCPVCWWSSGELVIGANARIGDDATILAGTLQIQGPIQGNLRATASRIVISAPITGSAELRAATIVLAEGASIGGELTARSPTPPFIAPGAVISGGVRNITSSAPFPDISTMRGMGWWLIVFLPLAAILGALLFGALAQLALPGLISQSAQRVWHQPWSCLGYGVAWALLVPTVALIFFSLVIGIPVAAFLIGALILSMMLAFVVAAYGVGLRIRQYWRMRTDQPGKWGRILWTLCGILVLGILAVIPVLGQVLLLIATLAGLGALVGAVGDNQRRASLRDEPAT